MQYPLFPESSFINRVYKGGHTHTMSWISLTPSERSLTREDIGGYPLSSNFVLSLEKLGSTTRKTEKEQVHAMCTIYRMSVPAYL